ncbi:MAG: DinB family protein [Chloroflexota bacterium]
MNIEPFLYQMERNGLSITWMVRDMSDDQAKWRPDEDSWSILEVMYHLIDAEREDFRQRLNYLLNMPGEPFPEIFPDQWPAERKYNDRDLMTAIKTFINERAKSIDWMRNLKTPNWENVTPHPTFGDISAADMFAAWAVHDHLHIRQLNEILYAWAKKEFDGRMIDYAGPW